MEEKTNVLEVRDLSVSYTVANVKTHVLEGVSFDVEKGKSVGIVGESGCGKTTTLRTILNVLPSNGTIESGEILYEGENILEMPKARLQEYRQKGAGMIFQDPSSALNPVISIKNQFLEALKYAHKDKKLTKTELLEKAAKSLETVSLADPDRILNSYPFQLSGGMRQRVCIAMTMAAQRQLLLADEPGTALDVTIQDQILRLIKSLVESGELSVVMVTHSLGVIRQVTTSVNIMYAGTIVEGGETKQVFENPQHPYTQALMDCLPKLTGSGIAKGIPGRIPDYSNPPKGCRFAPRCPYADEKCRNEKPVRHEISAEHWVACFQAEEGK
ncbi:ABC transporter ATP-binding protein [[Clostridium] hylemonae]|uniref:ABC transporter, ATP-binding protein n=1 Tax=[Clostridium] hylemonae DSM 15053 TaxID=553973 RepID=C0C286_9FIRM|nr:ABC transporter ATP-binding protein [[Clostridium] hylemonae]EEG73740.1 ABC transporter, ATP-binding protein [[Clostridium] hylemonae DSM 15053]QEK19126.1 Oligopeptide transport ATP-binding protein OppD [[Clostridium] hylemonae DSM 15053]BDF06071.1 peptide ABC transporter ATP-binding protein [[Clostridium] hylemonae]